MLIVLKKKKKEGLDNKKSLFIVLSSYVLQLIRLDSSQRIKHTVCVCVCVCVNEDIVAIKSEQQQSVRRTCR